MKRNVQFIFFVICYSILLTHNSCSINEKNDFLEYRKQNFNEGWKFMLGDYNDAIKYEFDDSEWNEIKIPHDWSIEGEINKNNPSGAQGGFYPGGIGFYRKSFSFDEKWKDKQVLITFDGVMSNSDVWINGFHLGNRPNGYVGFTYELTPYLKPTNNVLTVKADNLSQPNSRWYTGSGIYRNVWLIAKNTIAVAENGTFVKTDSVSTESAVVHIETVVENTTTETENIRIVSVIYDPNGKKVCEREADQVISNNFTSINFKKFKIEKPYLWSIESPQQYTLVTKLIENKAIIDEYVTKFGIRDIRFEEETGFWLNNKNIKIKGVNNHHDGGPVGAAVPNDVLHRRLVILKEMGCNAIRTAHNPFSPEFYNMCDSMGFLVMDEIFDEWIASWPWESYKDKGKAKYGYHLYFEEWAQKDLKDIVIRDRNHPCIIMWSVGNEIPDQCYPEGPERLKPLMETVQKLDNTRPVTCGCCFIHLANATGFASMLDVTGYNGGGNSVFYERDKATYPNRKFIATEVPHSYQTRGVYKTKSFMRAPNEGIHVPDLTAEEVFPEFHEQYCSSYDNSCVRITARDSWRRTDSLNYVAGEFRWTGYDYLGEAIKGWPARFWSHGIICLCVFPKDHFFFYKSQWTTEPMVHILPHWTWPGKEGKVIPVWTYSNADEVELFHNGVSLGKKSNKDKMNLSWDVVYTPGTLKAVAKTNGIIVAEELVKTAMKPAKIEIIADKQTINADGESCIHLEINVLDKDGVFVPNANNLLKFKIEGPAKNIGVDNGDPLDLTSTKTNEKMAFNGKCLLILQSQKNPGKIIVEITSDGLEPNKINLKSVSKI